ncbi:MAG: hypothetical protein ABI904_15500 [Chloroflexota bacterium]
MEAPSGLILARNALASPLERTSTNWGGASARTDQPEGAFKRLMEGLESLKK